MRNWFSFGVDWRRHSGCVRTAKIPKGVKRGRIHARRLIGVGPIVETEAELRARAQAAFNACDTRGKGTIQTEQVCVYVLCVVYLCVTIRTKQVREVMEALGVILDDPALTEIVSELDEAGMGIVFAEEFVGMVIKRSAQFSIRKAPTVLSSASPSTIPAAASATTVELSETDEPDNNNGAERAGGTGTRDKGWVDMADEAKRSVRILRRVALMPWRYVRMCVCNVCVCVRVRGCMVAACVDVIKKNVRCVHFPACMRLCLRAVYLCGG